MTNTAPYWIEKLNLQPHPEGGFYKEVFRSQIAINRVGDDQPKQAITTIYCLLEGIDYSGFHRLLSDEVWYFHKGSPLYIHVLNATTLLQTLELSDEPTGQLSIMIPAGTWGSMSLSCVSRNQADVNQPASYVNDGGRPSGITVHAWVSNCRKVL